MRVCCSSTVMHLKCYILKCDYLSSLTETDVLAKHQSFRFSISSGLLCYFLCSILSLDTLSFAHLLFFCALKTLKNAWSAAAGWTLPTSRSCLCLKPNPIDEAWDYSAAKPNPNVFWSKTLTFLLWLLTQRTSILSMKASRPHKPIFTLAEGNKFMISYIYMKQNILHRLACNWGLEGGIVQSFCWNHQYFRWRWGGISVIRAQRYSHRPKANKQEKNFHTHSCRPIPLSPGYLLQSRRY